MILFNEGKILKNKTNIIKRQETFSFRGSQSSISSNKSDNPCFYCNLFFPSNNDFS